MTRVRMAPLVGLVLVGGVGIFVAESCASPTQILVDVRVDSALCAKINTGIAVTSPDEIDRANLSVYQSGCRSTLADGQGQIGTLTITPSGADDAEVGIRIVGSVATPANPDACGRTDIDGKADWSSCILARRTVRFVAGETVNVTVRLTSDCVGQYCGDGRECSAGVCVRAEQVQNDGGVLDAEVVELDAGADAADAGADACAAWCKGPLATCEGKTCTIDCTGNKKCDKNVVCGGDLDCNFKCGGESAVNDTCNGVACTTSGACTFDCTGPGNDHCKNVSCRGSSCTVACSNTYPTCRGVFMDAGVDKISCAATVNGNPSCRDVVCSGDCTRTCDDGGLGCTQGDNSSCTPGDCTKWEDAGPDATVAK